MNKITENCPFCGLGGELLEVATVRDQHRVEFFVVRCGHCLADGPMSLDQDAAVFYWNKRACRKNFYCNFLYIVGIVVIILASLYAGYITPGQ